MGQFARIHHSEAKAPFIKSYLLKRLQTDPQPEVGSLFAAATGACQNFSEVEGPDVGELIDLLAATEAIGDDDGGWGGGLESGKQAIVRDGLRDLEFIGFEAEGAGHAAASGLDGLDRCAGLAEERDFAGRAAEDGFVMAVAVQQNVRALEAPRDEIGREIRRLGGEEIGEKPDLPAQALRAGVVGKEFQQFVFEDAGAAWLEEDERQASLDLRSHAAENFGEIGAGGREKAEVVERAAAADVALRGFNLKAGLGEDGFCRGERLRVVVVVPGVGPEENFSSGGRWGFVGFPTLSCGKDGATAVLAEGDGGSSFPTLSCGKDGATAVLAEGDGGSSFPTLSCRKDGATAVLAEGDGGSSFPTLSCGKDGATAVLAEGDGGSSFPTLSCGKDGATGLCDSRDFGSFSAPGEAVGALALRRRCA